MLVQALNRHAEIAVPPETGYFTHFIGHTRRGQIQHLRRINADLGIALPDPKRRIRGRPATAEFFDRMLMEHAATLDGKSVTWYGEKTPHHLLRMPRLLRTFPDAKYILAYRDGRDVALSLTKVPWFNNDLDVTFGYWLRCYRWHKWLVKRTGVDLLLVRYEDLVQRPEEELRRVSGFLGIEYEPQMAEGSGNREVVVRGEKEWMARALEPIQATRIGNWRRELSAEQIARLECRGRAALTELGYELVTQGGQRLSVSYYPSVAWKTLVWRAGNACRLIRKNLLGR